MSGSGSLLRYSQSLPREYARCLGRLACGHVGLRPAALWLLTVIIDMCRAGRAPKSQAAAINEAGLARSTGKRAMAELEAGGFLQRGTASVVVAVPSVDEVRAALAANCRQCGGGAEKVAGAGAAERVVRSTTSSSAPSSSAAGVAQEQAREGGRPEWAASGWFENLSRRVGAARASQACAWTAHRMNRGAEIESPRGYAATIAEVYAGRRQGLLGQRRVEGVELERAHAAELREAEAGRYKQREAAELEEAAHALLDLGILDAEMCAPAG